MNTNTSRQQELGIEAAKQPVLVRVGQAAKELWPLVKHEKRSSGSPCFASLDSLRAQLNTAFRKNLIPGHREKKRIIWLDREAAIDWVTRYCEYAKNAKGMTVTKFKPRATKPRSNGSAIKAEPPVSNGYILVDSDGKIAHFQATSNTEALVGALRMAKISVHRINGHNMDSLTHV